MVEYVDSKIIPIFKFVHQEIDSNYLNTFINYQLKQRFENTKKKLIYFNFHEVHKLYSIFTLDMPININQSFYIKAFEFHQYYTKNTNDIDVFIYNIKSSYFFALYINSKIAYFNSIYFDNNIDLLIEKINDFITVSFNLSIDNFYILIKQQTKNMITKSINIIFIPDSFKPKKVDFFIPKISNINYQTYIKYLLSLLILFFGYIGFIIIENSSQSLMIEHYKDIFSKNNKIKNQPRDYLKELKKISDDFYGCNILIQNIKIDLKKTILTVKSNSKDNLLKCIKNKHIHISSISHNNGKIDAELQYKK